MATIIVREASLVDTFAACLLLVANYVKKGYLPEPSLDGLSKYWKVLRSLFAKKNANKQTIVARDGSRVVGTISYYIGASFPIETMFPEELALLRKKYKLAYAGFFAINKEYRCTRLAVRMILEAQKRCTDQGATGEVCVVNPCHVKFYLSHGFHVVKEISQMEGLEKGARAVLLAKLPVEI